MTEKTSAGEVVMMSCRAKSPYMQTATKARNLEAEGALEAAGKLWGHAAVEAIREENRAWAWARQAHCLCVLKKEGVAA
ncbi:ANR family transcriptional regulator [Aeromonas jandaei]|uniref:ANR family transcriptional regulator n=1 Tax=Aeromonas jandaei TaxID=650 RepID=UPI001ADD9179|nr:ANR family transcriptional regulator [Aeromonas jandaei]QTL95551.1 hypothetical protein AjGTCBM29_03470 [Aeromonas jandaei]